MMPARRPSASATPVTPKPVRLMVSSASVMGVASATSGISACIRSATVASRAPSLPPGWKVRKCSGVKRRCSISATASASPSASVMVVEVVGTMPPVSVIATASTMAMSTGGSWQVRSCSTVSDRSDER